MTVKTITVSKLDAAKRQLDSAIDLWFHDGDDVAIHTLVFAAYEIIQDINKKHGNTDATLLGLVQRNVIPERVEDAMRLLKKAMTFFKHADRDPHGILEFNPEVSESLIELSMMGLGALGESATNLQKAFVIWDCFHKPHVILQGANPIQNLLPVVDIESLKTIGKGEFLNTVLLGLAKGRIKG
jgi:hypothetical protein